MAAKGAILTFTAHVPLTASVRAHPIPFRIKHGHISEVNLNFDSSNTAHLT